jgi:Ala-tRNA(Pro) deacylase
VSYDSIIYEVFIMAIAITLQEYLDNSGISYELISHPYTHSSSETARVGNISADKLAKSVLLEDAYGDYFLAVIPSNHRLDFGPLKKQLNIRLGLATESELGEVFDDCQPGAIPAVAQAYGIPVIVDESLSSQSDIYFEAGSHTDIVHLDGQEFDQLMERSLHGRFSHHV